MKILYHANCNDGAGAALAVWKKYGDTGHTYIPVQYGNDLPDELNNCDVVMVDFSAKKQQIRDLARKANSILIIDHHKTAQAELEDVDDGYGCSIETVFDMEKSGAVLAWEYFHPDKALPSLFLHIQDRDLWQFKFAGTRGLHTGLSLFPEWREWLGLDLTYVQVAGDSINKYLNQQSRIILRTPPMKWDIEDVVIPVYNLPGFMISDTLHMALEKYTDVPYAVAFIDLPDKRVYSLRSRAGSDVDVSVIAAAHGGGGHKHAAGFVVMK